jgi:hypothetical protein
MDNASLLELHKSVETDTTTVAAELSHHQSRLVERPYSASCTTTPSSTLVTTMLCIVEDGPLARVGHLLDEICVACCSILTHTKKTGIENGMIQATTHQARSHGG